MVSTRCKYLESTPQPAVFIKVHVIILLLCPIQIIAGGGGGGSLRTTGPNSGRRPRSQWPLFISQSLVMTPSCVCLRVGGPLDDSLVDRVFNGTVVKATSTQGTTPRSARPSRRSGGIADSWTGPNWRPTSASRLSGLAGNIEHRREHARYRGQETWHSELRSYWIYSNWSDRIIDSYRYYS